MSKIKNNLYFKIGGIVLIALLLLIPTGMIKSIIYEREQTQREAIPCTAEQTQRASECEPRSQAPRCI